MAVIHGIRLERRLNALPATLRAVTVDAENGRLGAAQEELIAAQNTLTSVNSALYNSPDFQFVGWLPVARQNIRAVRSAVQVGLQMVAGGESILQAAAPLQSEGELRVPLIGGMVPLQTLESVDAAVQDVASGLPTVTAPRLGSLVVGPVKKRVDRVFAEAVRRRAELASVGASLRVLDDIAGASGNRTYLIAVSNSAEMRGSGGMILSYGVLSSSAGKVTLDRFGPIDEIKLATPQTVATFPADYTAKYGDLNSTSDWREVNVMSDFTVDAPVMEAMYQHATGKHVDGVIQIDSAGLAAILAGVGPVTTPDLGTVTSSDAVALTLSTAYLLYPDRTTRQDYAGEVAQTAFQRLTSGEFRTLKPLGSALLHASDQRHVLMYTNDPTDEAAIRDLGFDGSLPPATADFAQLTMQNFGADKLDYYLESSLTLTGHRPSQTGSRMTASIVLRNTAPAGRISPREVFGPFLPGEQVGEYNGLVTLYLPAGSYLKGSVADASVTTPPTMGSQNGVRTITFTVAVPAGMSSRVSLDIFVPPTPTPPLQFGFVPSPRVLPTQFSSKLS